MFHVEQSTAIDLFAGAGGFTVGAEAAGVRVLWAANHWGRAVDVHQQNHPEVTHSCQDLMQADWGLVPAHDLLLASPACQGHSPASQPRRLPRHNADRNTAWAVVMAAEACRPRTILIENVTDFLRWPLIEPWLDCFRRLGYEVRIHVFDVADFGVPQNRRRAIISARLEEPLELTSPELVHQPFGQVVEWGTGRWKLLSSKPPGVRRRVEAARARGCGDRFLTHYVTGHRGRELSRPIGCITTKDQWAVVDGARIRMLTIRELTAGMSFPQTYVLPETKGEAVRMLGNAIPPLFAAELVRQAAA